MTPECVREGKSGMTRSSRRALLTGTLGSALMAQVDTAPEVRFPRKIRLALAGFDGHPEEILRVLPQVPDVELVAVANEESDAGAQANVLKNRYAAKARRYETLTKMLLPSNSMWWLFVTTMAGGLPVFWPVPNAKST